MKSPLRSEKFFDMSLVEQTVGGTDDAVTEYAYDHVGRVTSIEQYGVTGGNEVAEKRVEYTYDALGQYATVTTYADLAGADLVSLATYTYDHVGLLTGLVYTQGQTTLASYAYAYTYDLLGDVLTMATVDGTTTYTYDHLGQLASTDSTDSDDESYTYDETGNRITANAATYTTDAENRLLSDGTYRYAYDAEGNRTMKFVWTDTDTDGVVEDGERSEITVYTWDYRNRLASVSTYADDAARAAGTSTSDVAYTYDYANRMISRTVDSDGTSGSETVEKDVFVYDGSEVALDFVHSGSGDATAADLADRYLWDSQSVDRLFADEKLAWDDVQEKSASDDLLWALVDHQNSVRDLATYDSGTDTTSIVNHRIYDAYGNLTPDADSTVDCVFGYTGRYKDSETGLQNNLNRWYDSTTGRWLSTDPLSFAAGDTNLYRYVGNSPATYVDPLGLCSEDKEQFTSTSDGDNRVELMAWHVERKGGKVAKVWSDDPEHDTKEDLAKLLGLDAKDADKWLTNKQWNKEKGRWEYDVPNTVIVYWAGELGETGQTLVRWKKDIAYLESLGFNVVVKQYGKDKGNWDSKALVNGIKQASAAGELYGFYFWGHGYPEGIAHKTGGFHLTYADILAALQYKLGLVLLNTCYSGYSKGDVVKIKDYQTPPGGLVAGGHDLVSGIGKFHGANGVLYPIKIAGLPGDLLVPNHAHPWNIIDPGDFGTDPNATKPIIR